MLSKKTKKSIVRILKIVVIVVVAVPIITSIINTCLPTVDTNLDSFFSWVKTSVGQ